MWRRTIWAVALIVGALGLIGFTIAGANEEPLKVGEAVDLQPSAKPVTPGEYWLGVEAMPVPPALRAHLNLPEGQGLLVGGVVADSPAAKAGLKEHDILLQAGGKPLTDISDLIAAVNAAKETKLSLIVIRGGKQQTIEVVPAKRPAEFSKKSVGTSEDDDWGTLQKWLEGMRSKEGGFDGWGPFRFRFFHPGMIVPKDVPLPGNMLVVITKEGDQPAKIMVRRGEEKWELTEKELDKLPADVRPHVERMLGRGAVGIIGGAKGFDFDLFPDVGPDFPAPEGKFMPDLQRRLEKRLDEMNRRIDRLFEMMEEMSGRSGREPSKSSE